MMISTAASITRPSCQKSREWLLSSFAALVVPHDGYMLRRRSSTAPATRQSRTAQRATSKYALLATSRHAVTWKHALQSRFSTQISARKESVTRDLDSLYDEGSQIVEVEPDSATASEGTQATGTTAEVSSNSYVPWYLEHKSDIQSSIQHTASGQELPDIPEHSPDILEPVVKHVLETLGLTHLRILDLREMTDPPPALGANLLMVVATARSERHLHASADKLCRWLRTEYKLTPFADGLLGRNEMKIALRRRARRAKMMSAVGAKTANEGDLADGLRSEWICVNIGRIKGGILPDLARAQAEKEVIGFGTADDSSTIVLQMMTEEKREEIDIEGLWESALRRQKRAKDEITGKANDEDIENDPSVAHTAATSGHGPLSTTTFNPFQNISDRATAQ